MEEERPNYYAIIPAIVRYDDDLCPNAKLLYGEITCLCNKSGYCYATNKYFAKIYKVSKETISRWIKQLCDKSYINIMITYYEGTNAIDKRIICLGKEPIDEIVNTYYQNHQEGIDKKIKHNNTSINSNNNIYEIVEKEFGRPLSPMEIEMISSWDYPIEILKLAVKEASTNGQFVMKYIDRIIYRWKRANVRTVEEAKKYIEKFYEAKEKKGNQPNKQVETLGTGYEVLD